MQNQNQTLSKAKKAKNDEFYTMLSDIENECQHYTEQFREKVIYCNCDDPEKSNFYKYFKEHFSEFGLKKLITSHYTPGSKSYMTEMTSNCETVCMLQGDGDFRSQECLDLLDEADIVVTNPPFSLFREYVVTLMEHDKKFLIIGNINAITYKEIFPLLKNNQMWIGYNHVNAFKTPSDVKKFGSTEWFTNLNITKRHEEMILIKKYDPKMYPHYDNYNAIEVNKTANIPYNYKDIMGVPITFLEKYNPDQFEILGLTSGRNEFDKCAWPSKRYINAKQINKDETVVNGSKANTRATILLNTVPDNTVYYTADNADSAFQIVYARILIRYTDEWIQNHPENFN